MNRYTAMKIVLVGALLMGMTGLLTDFYRARTASVTQVEGGNAGRGKQAMQTYGCGSCHAIPGVTGAHGNVGPPLSGISERSYIAGKLPNDPGNMIYWLQNPQAVWPGNAMPNLGVSDQDARDIAAYLYTVK